MTPYYPVQDNSEDTAEQKRSSDPSADDLKYITPSPGGTSTVWMGLGIDARRYEEDMDTLFDGWRACLKRRIAEEKPLIEED